MNEDIDINKNTPSEQKQKPSIGSESYKQKERNSIMLSIRKRGPSQFVQEKQPIQEEDLKVSKRQDKKINAMKRIKSMAEKSKTIKVNDTYLNQVKIKARQFFNKCCPKSFVVNNKQQQTQNDDTLVTFNDELQEILESLSTEEKLQKAIRHFYDGYLLRTPRNDIDGSSKRSLRLIWQIINDSTWNHFLWLMVLIYELSVFWEAPHQNSIIQNDNSFIVTLSIESFTLLLIITDTILNISFVVLISENQGFQNIFKSLKITCKLIFTIILISDYVYYLINYPINIFRYGRFIRGFLIISFSKDMRRNVRGIVDSISNLLVLFLLYMVVIFLWAFIGINLIGDIDEFIPIDKKTMDYGDFMNLSYMLYVLSTMDNFPDIVNPTIRVSQYYSIYFIIFLLIFLFLFVPIPQALVYDDFRKYRRQVQVRDHNKQQKALALCFFCLDETQQNEISYEQAKEFFSIVYEDKSEDSDLEQLLKSLDFDDSQSFSLEEFYHIFLIASKYPKYSLNRIKALSIWNSFLKYLNTHLKLKDFVQGIKFNMFMILLVLINCVLIFVSFTITDQETINIFEIIDKVFFAFYALEVILKILGLGIYDYFDDIWNNFDFFIVICQVFFDFILIGTITTNLSSTIKANRVLRLAKIQKVFRLFRAFRSFKIFTVLIDSLKIFQKVNDVLYKILQCLPIVIRFGIIIWTVLYCYAVAATEFLNDTQLPGLLNQDKNVFKLDPCNVSDLDMDEVYYIQYSLNLFNKLIEWSECKFSDFNRIENSLLMLIQIFIYNWAEMLKDYAHKKNSYTAVTLFFGSFVLISIFQLALISGLVWEIFTRMNSNEEEEEKQVNTAKDIRTSEENEEQKKVERGSIKKTSYLRQIAKISAASKHFHRDSLILFSFNDDYIQINSNINSQPGSQIQECDQNICNNEAEIKKGFMKCVEVQQKIKNSFTKYQEQNKQKLLDEKNSSDKQSNTNSLKMENDYKKFIIINSEYFKAHQQAIYQELQDIKIFNQYRAVSFFIEKNMTQQQRRSSLSANILEEKQQQDILAFQKNFLNNLQTILGENQSLKLTLDTTIAIEYIITKQCLIGRSFTKMIFQSSNENWFTLNKKKEKFYFSQITKGPWILDGLNTENPLDNIYFYQFKTTNQSTHEKNLLNSLKSIEDMILYSGGKPEELSQNEECIKIILVCCYKSKIKIQKVQKMVQIWYLETTPKMQKFIQRIQQINSLKNQPKGINLMNIVDMAQTNQKQEENKDNGIERHNISQAIYFAQQLWLQINKYESQIRERVSELLEKRNQFAEGIKLLQNY